MILLKLFAAYWSLLSLLYLALAVGLLILLGGPWFLLRRKVGNGMLRAAVLSLILAFAISPVVIAGDRASGTLPFGIWVGELCLGRQIVPPNGAIHIVVFLVLWSLLFLLLNAVSEMRHVVKRRNEDLAVKSARV